MNGLQALAFVTGGLLIVVASHEDNPLIPILVILLITVVAGIMLGRIDV